MRIDIRAITPIQWLAVCISLLIALLLLGFELYERRTEALFERAFLDPQAQDAINQLAKRRGRTATNLLLRLARQESFRRTDALAALGKRTDDDIPEMLASFLEPHEYVQMRRVAAEGLTSKRCEFECVRAILHYRERAVRKVAFAEDWMNQGKYSSEDARYEMAAQRERLDLVLDDILKNSSSTADVLREVYGVGSPVPDPFALEVIDRIKLTASCNDLAAFDRRFKPHPIESETQPEQARFRERLREIRKRVGCEGTPER